MKNIVIYIFLFSITFWGFNQTRSTLRSLPTPDHFKTWEIIEISNDKIISFLDLSDTLKKIPNSAIGYPVKYQTNDEVEYWDDNKNRYLFRFGEQYCIADSNLKIIIGLSDSIIPSILYDTLGLIKIDYDEGSYTCVFQVIKNNLTQLITNDGKIITPIPYTGIINFSFFQLQEALTQEVFITRTIDENKSQKYGIINFEGQLLLPNQYDQIISPKHWTLNPYLLLTYYSPTNSRDNEYSVFSVNATSIIFTAKNMELQLEEHEVYTFEKNGLFGVYHPFLSIIKKPKFLKIYPKKNALSHMFNDLILITKKGKEKKWIIPKKIWNLYPTLNRD